MTRGSGCIRMVSTAWSVGSPPKKRNGVLSPAWWTQAFLARQHCSDLRTTCTSSTRTKKGILKWLADGLALYLNTDAVDEEFRRFNGHTQVNATDLRAMKYPSRSALMRWSTLIAATVAVNSAESLPGRALGPNGGPGTRHVALPRRQAASVAGGIPEAEHHLPELQPDRSLAGEHLSRTQSEINSSDRRSSEVGFDVSSWRCYPLSVTISRTGGQIPVKPHQRSHMSGKHQMRFAARLKDNLDLQCLRLEQELCSRFQRTENELIEGGIAGECGDSPSRSL